LEIQRVERLNRVRLVTVFAAVALATMIGVLIGRSI
jgi:hypothetical protein